MEPRDHLATIANQLKAGGSTEKVTVRTFLSWFGIKRRGYFKVRDVRYELKRAGLVTVPDFEGEYIDGLVGFTLATATEGAKAALETATTSEPTDIDSAAPIDPTNRIGKLPAANTKLVSVKPESSLQEATSLMRLRDFSQLPVMQSEFSVKGVISWRSIGERTAAGLSGTTAKDFMEEPVVVSSDASLFSVISTIVDREYALIRNPSGGKISGIVTTTDLSLQFRQLSEPFLLLGEIENHLRAIIGRVFGVAELKAAVDPGDSSRTVRTVADLTFGEYLRLIENPAHWSKLSLAIDRAVFVESLERVREIRNEVMHFDPDPLAEEDLSALRNLARFLQTLMSVRGGRA